MKKTENYNFEILSLDALLNTNGGSAPAEGSYSLGHLIGSVIRTTLSVSLISFGMFNY